MSLLFSIPEGFTRFASPARCARPARFPRPGRLAVTLVTGITLSCTLLLSQSSRADRSDNTIVADPPSRDGLWRYHRYAIPPAFVVNQSTYPTSVDAMGSAQFIGYTDGPDGAGNVEWDNGSNGEIGERPVHRISTWLVSEFEGTIPVLFHGHDAHGLFIDGTFVGGGGFGYWDSESYPLGLTAYRPVHIEIVMFNDRQRTAAIGGGGSALTWSGRLQAIPGIRINADQPPAGVGARR